MLIVSCLDQLTVSGGGSANPATVNFPGAYSASDPGIQVNIHSAMSNYVNPGPAVYSGGTTKKAGSACGAGAESGTGTGPVVTPSNTTPGTPEPTPTQGGGDGGCKSEKWQQCGGQGFSGCTTCAVSIPRSDY